MEDKELVAYLKHFKETGWLPGEKEAASASLAASHNIQELRQRLPRMPEEYRILVEAILESQKQVLTIQSSVMLRLGVVLECLARQARVTEK